MGVIQNSHLATHKARGLPFQHYVKRQTVCTCGIFMLGCLLFCQFGWQRLLPCLYTFKCVHTCVLSQKWSGLSVIIYIIRKQGYAGLHQHTSCLDRPEIGHDSFSQHANSTVHTTDMKWYQGFTIRNILLSSKLCIELPSSTMYILVLRSRLNAKVIPRNH